MSKSKTCLLTILVASFARVVAAQPEDLPVGIDAIAHAALED